MLNRVPDNKLVNQQASSQKPVRRMWVLRVTVIHVNWPQYSLDVWYEALQFFDTKEEAEKAARARRQEQSEQWDGDEEVRIRCSISITESVPLSQRDIDSEDEEDPSVHHQMF